MSHGAAINTIFQSKNQRDAWRRREEGTRLGNVDPKMTRVGESKGDFMVCLSNVQKKIVPADYELSDSQEEEIWVFGIGGVIVLLLG